MDDSLRKTLEGLIKKDDVVLFMKGSRHFPQCGFSAQVVGILNELVPKYETVNVLSDPAIREGIKEFSSWPTIPQLYVKGTFVGGCDIVKEMHASGELAALLGSKPAEVKAPSIALTGAATKAFKDALGDGSEDVVRLEVNAEFQYELYIGAKQANDLVCATAGGLPIHTDRDSARRADGMVIDFVEQGGGGFKIENPNEPPRVKSIGPEELKALLDKKTKLELFDVRTDKERAIATIEGARHLDAEGEAYLASLDKGTMLVFQCHHGMRSRSAAERFLREGFRNVWNLEGGIEAWSARVDPNVPRY